MRRINEIIVHCSATRPTMDIGTAEIRGWHVNDNGWSDIGYHYVIRRNGEIEDGRPLDRRGAHCYGRNANSVGICLIGGHGSCEHDEPEDHYTPAQMAALHGLCIDLVNEYPVTLISGHNEYAAKACPGFQVQPWAEEMALAIFA